MIPGTCPIGATINGSTTTNCIECDEGYTLSNGVCNSNAQVEEINEIIEQAGGSMCADNDPDCIAITLVWDNDDGTKNDLDMHVFTPAGNELYFSNKEVDGGVLDVDRQESTLKPIENVIFTDAAPGEYRVEVKNYSADHNTVTPFTVVIVQQGYRRLYEFNMPGEEKAVIEAATITVA